MLARKKIAAPVAEFFGTFVLASAVLAMAGRTDFPFFPAVAAGMAVAVMVLVIGPVSGAHINPAVTLALWTRRKVSATTAVVYVVVQMLGGFTAWQVNQYLIDETVANMAKTNWDLRVVIAEAIGTFVLGFGIAAAVSNKYEGGRLAAAVGGSLFGGVLLASFAAAGTLNPAVALGVQAWSLSYVVAPLVGAVLGMHVHALVMESRSAPAKK